MGGVAILDYGVGNLKSIANALRYIGLEPQVTADPQVIARADGVILPGVGAFPDAAQKLTESGLNREIALQGETKPVLGICLGMQLLFDSSDEVHTTAGLGLIPGHVERIDTDLKLPHIGWNSLRFENQCPLFRGLEEGVSVYFVHSFQGRCRRREDVAAWTDYGGPVLAAVRRGNFYGCQFHPEKSGDVGLHILRNFGELCR